MGDLDELKRLLSDELCSPDVALFIGAGVNGGAVPQWPELLNSLLKNALSHVANGSGGFHASDRKDLLKWMNSTSGPSLYDQAELVRYFLGPQYVQMLHAELYRRVSPGKIDEITKMSPFPDSFRRVADLCQAPRVRAVVSFNYDSLLGEAVEWRGRAVSAVHGRRQSKIGGSELPFYHVHGYLPREQLRRCTDADTIVLTREEYHRVFREPYAWQNTIPIHLLRTCVCIFIGASMTDMNMLRLASHAADYATDLRAFVMKSRLDADCSSPARIRITATQLRLAHAELVIADDYDQLAEQIHGISKLLSGKEN